MLLSLFIACCQILTADESPADQTPSSTPLSQETTRTAIQKAIAPLQQGAAVSAKERKCFTCHNQAMPVIALTEVAKRGFAVDQNILQQQLQHTWDHLEKGKLTYQAGSGQGGQVMTAGYAMWTLETGGWKSDETTAAVIHYLTEFQKDQNHWLPSSKRLPSMGSSFTTTYVALRAMSYFGTDKQTAGIAARRDAAAKWVLETEPTDTEDRVFRLRTLPYMSASDDILKKAVDALLAKQRTDGGWSQTDEMTSDAYATAIVVTALQDAGQLTGDHPAILSGCRYLIDTQREDGTWHVKTHAKPIQTYYESGFPHGEDQFISIAATAWATLALAETLPETKVDITPASQPELVEVRRIWDTAAHNAFTDLLYHDGRWYCVFREGSKHVSPDGSIRVITSEDGKDWTSLALISHPTDELRDAKLCITPDGRFMLNGAGLRADEPIRYHSMVWFSEDKGKTWDAGRRIGDPGFWLWRVQWHDGTAYTMGYGTDRDRTQRQLRLYKSSDGATFEPLVQQVNVPNGVGEDTMVFTNKGTALCLLRCETGSKNGLLGSSRPPFTEWTWKELEHRIGGPDMIQLPDRRILAATRLHSPKTRTSLSWIDPEAGTMTECLELPSGGDTSYAGMVLHDGLLWVSYYSSHEEKTCIYLAKVRL